MESLGVQVELDRRKFNEELGRLKQDLRDLQGGITRDLASMGGARAGSRSGGRGGGGIENDLIVLRAETAEYKKQADVQSGLRKATEEAAVARKRARVEVRGATEEQKEETTQLNRTMNALRDVSRGHDDARKKLSEYQKELLRGRKELARLQDQESNKLTGVSLGGFNIDRGQVQEARQKLRQLRAEQVAEDKISGKKLTEQAKEQFLQRLAVSNEFIEQARRGAKKYNADTIVNERAFNREMKDLKADFISEVRNLDREEASLRRNAETERRKNLREQIADAEKLNASTKRTRFQSETFFGGDLTRANKERRALIAANQKEDLEQRNRDYRNSIEAERKKQQALIYEAREGARQYHAERRKILNGGGSGRGPGGPPDDGGGGIFGRVGSFFTRFAAFTLAAGILTRGFFAVENALQNIVARGIEFNKSLETTKLSLTAILVSSRQLVSSTGEVASIASSYPVFLEKAKAFQKELLLLNITTLGTGEELTNVFQRVLAFSQDQVATDKERLQLATNILNAGKLLGFSGEQINTETRQILTLERDHGQAILQSLGVSVKQLRTYEEQGTLVQKLNELLKAYSVIAADVGLTFEGLTSTVETFFLLLAGQSFESTFGGLKSILKGAGDELKEISESGSALTSLGLSVAELENLGRNLAQVTNSVVRAMAELTNATLRFATNHEGTWRAAGSIISVTTNILGGFAHVIDTVIGGVDKLANALSYLKPPAFLSDSKFARVATAFVTGGAVGALTLNPAIAATAAGASALKAALDFDAEQKAIVDFAKTGKGRLEDLAQTMKELPQAIKNNPALFQNYLRAMKDISKELDALKAAAGSLPNPVKEETVRKIQVLQDELAKLVGSLEKAKNGFDNLISEKTKKLLEDFSEDLTKLNNDVKFATKKTAITREVISGGGTPDQVEVRLGGEEAVRFLDENRAQFEEAIKARNLILKEFEEQEKKIRATASADSVGPPIPTDRYNELRELLDDPGLKELKGTFEETRKAAFDLGVTLVQETKSGEKVIENYENQIQAQKDLKTALEDLSEEAAQANRRTEQLVANLSQDPGNILALRIKEINTEIEKEKGKLENRLGGKLPENLVAKLEEVRKTRIGQATVDDVKDFEQQSKRRIDAAEKEAEAIRSFLESEISIRQLAAESRKEDLELQLRAAENNFGISNKPLNTLEDQKRLLAEIGREEVKLLDLSAEREKANIDVLEAKKNALRSELQNLDALIEADIAILRSYGASNPDIEAALRSTKGPRSNALQAELKVITSGEEESKAKIQSIGDATRREIFKTQDAIDDLGKTIIDFNNPIANAFGNLFDALQKGGKGIKGVFKTLQKDISQSFSDAFRESIKKKLQFDIEFKGNIFDLGNYFKDTFSNAVSFVGKLFGNAGGASGGGFFSGLTSLFGGSSASSSSSSGGGFLSSIFPMFGGGSGGSGGTGWQLARAGTYGGIPVQGNSALFNNGASTLGSLFGFGSSGGYTSTQDLSGSGGLSSLFSNFSNIANVASLASLFSGAGGGGLNSLLGNIGNIGTAFALGNGLFSSGGLFGGLFGGAAGSVGTAGWQLAGAGTYAGIPAIGTSAVTNGGLGFGGGLSGAFGGALGGIGGNLLGGFINDTFGIGQTKQGKTGSMIGGAVGGIGGGIAGGALAGATLGSVVPVIGTIIGAFIGALAGVIGGGALGDLMAPSRIKLEKMGIDKFFGKVFEDDKFKTLSENKTAGGFEEFKGPVSGAAIALGAEYATEAKGGNAGTIVRFAGQGLGNFKRLGVDSEEAKTRILELAEAMDFDIKSGVEALSDNINKGILGIGEFKEEMTEARKNLKVYGDTSQLTAKELSDLATANGNTGSRLVTVNEIIAGTIDIYAEFDELVNGAAIANEYLAKSFIGTAKSTEFFNSDVQSLSDKISDGTLSLEEATIELNKFRKEAGLAALDLEDFKISATELQERVDMIKAAMQTLRDAVKGGLTAGFTVKEFDRAEIEKNIKKAVYGAMANSIAEGMVDGIIKGALVSGPISKAFTQIGDLTSKFVAGDLSEADFFSELDTVFRDVGPSVDKLATAVGLSSERMRQMLSDAGILPLLLDDAAASAGGLADAIRTGIDSGVKGMSNVDIADQFKTNIYTSIYESVLSGFTNGFIEAAAFSGPIADAMDSIADLNQDFLDGTITQSEYLAGIRTEFSNIEPIIETIAAATGLASEELRKMLADAGILPHLLEESVGVLGQITDAASGALKAGVRAVDFDRKDVEKNFRRSIYSTLVDTVADGFIDGIIKGTLASGPIEAAMRKISDLTSKFAAGDISEAEFFTNISDEFDAITPMIERIAIAVGLTTEKFREILEAAGILPDILDDAASNAEDLAKELRQAAKDLLLDANLSPLKPKQRVAEAQATFEELRLKALAGDEEAARQLPEAARQFLEEARKVFASSAQYEQIFDFVRGTLLDVADKFGPLEDTAEKQLRTLEEIRTYLASVDINLAKLSGGDAAKPNSANAPIGQRPQGQGPTPGSNFGYNGPANTWTLPSQNQGPSSGANFGMTGPASTWNSPQGAGRNNPETDGKSGDRLYHALNPERRGEAGTTNTLLQDTKDILNRTLDELGFAKTDQERNAAELKVIDAAQLLALQTISDTLISADKTLKKISGEKQSQQILPEIGQRSSILPGTAPTGRSGTSNVDSLQGDRLAHALGVSQANTENTGTAAGGLSNIIGLLQSIDSTLKKPATDSGTGGFDQQAVSSLKSVLDEIKDAARLIQSYSYLTAFNTGYLILIHNKMGSSASLAEGGIVTGREVSATLHGPEAVIPLNNENIKNFFSQSQEDATPLPYSSRTIIQSSSPELIEEVRMLRSELRDSNRNDPGEQNIVVQGDFNVGQEKLGEFVMKKVQNGFDKKQFRVPQGAISRF